MFSVNRKHRLYRTYNDDIWSVLRTKQSLNNTFVYFIKQFKEKKQPLSAFAKSAVVRRNKRVTLYGELLSYRKRLFYFYGGINSKYASSSSNVEEQRLHLFFTIVTNWELRLSSILYRLNFCSTTIEAVHYVLSGAVCVNKEVVKNTRHTAKPGDIIEVTESFKPLFFQKIFERMPTITLFQPPYFEVSLTTLAAVLLFVPNPKDLYYPFEIDTYSF